MVARILLIDDDTADCEIFQEIISSIDASVVVITASNGKQALEVTLLKDKPNYIFLDLNMPGMDGIECLTKLKANRSTRKIPVILYTSSDNEMEKTLALKLGAFDVVSKASDMHVLRERIKEVISLSQYH